MENSIHLDYFEGISDHDAAMVANVLEELSHIEDYNFSGAEVVVDGLMNEVYATNGDNDVVYSAKNDKVWTDTEAVHSFDLNNFSCDFARTASETLKQELDTKATKNKSSIDRD